MNSGDFKTYNYVKILKSNFFMVAILSLHSNVRKVKKMHKHFSTYLDIVYALFTYLKIVYAFFNLFGNCLCIFQQRETCTKIHNGKHSTKKGKLSTKKFIRMNRISWTYPSKITLKRSSICSCYHHKTLVT